MIRACIFDVFGTLVDWRGSVSRQAAQFAAERGIDGVDWLEFTMAWRACYQPALEEVRSGRRPWVILDVLHRESLVALLDRYGVNDLCDDDLDHLNLAWHRLEPWPDVVPGLTRLKQTHLIAPCSNGNIAFMVGLARHAGLPWDCILGAEPARAYKPQPEVYLTSCRLLGLAPAEVMMAAAHPSDLEAARSVGLATCFIPRPLEFGPDPTTDHEADPGAVDLRVADVMDLAEKIRSRT